MENSCYDKLQQDPLTIEHAVNILVDIIGIYVIIIMVELIEKSITLQLTERVSPYLLVYALRCEDSQHNMSSAPGQKHSGEEF